jgi:hypothetical protein
VKNALVKKAAAMLDRRYPGWHQKVKLDRLHLGASTACVTAHMGLNPKQRAMLPKTVLYATLWDDYAPGVGFISVEDVQVPWENEIRVRQQKARS